MYVVFISIPLWGTIWNAGGNHKQVLTHTYRTKALVDNDTV